ncbi:hypothetical protein PR048_015449 [Dryococelus australis]|uniref:Uncharacterized protein n=1 Tax=Dryococelus australis TaxID=614101 RepID=A0ABQ9HGZ6_9NEOP|nr:hypothetical protein PR048_015449 [Dryococelus australis]
MSCSGSLTQQGRFLMRMKVRDPSHKTKLFEEQPHMSLIASERLQILNPRLGKKAHYIHIVHELHQEDCPTRAAMCADLVERIENEGLMEHNVFTDKATLHTCGKVNRHSCSIWAAEKRR